jgi:hypothetical protein
MRAKHVVGVGAVIAAAVAGGYPTPSVAGGMGDMMNPSKWFGGGDRSRDYDYYRGPGYGWGGYPGYGWGGHPGYGWGGYPGYGPGYGWGVPGYAYPAQQQSGSAAAAPAPPPRPE